MKSLSLRKRVDLCPQSTVLLHSTARRDSTVANQDVGLYPVRLLRYFR